MIKYAATALLLSAISINTYGAGAGNFAQETTQWLNNAELVMANGSLIEQIKNMELNTLPVTDYQWGEFIQQVRKLHNIVQTGHAIAYSAKNLEAMFKRRYPGYQSDTDYFLAYADWANGSIDSILGALRSAGVQTEQIEQEEHVAAILRSLDMASLGRKQVLQVSNQIKNLQLAKLGKLQQLLMAMQTAQGNYQAYVIQEQAKRRSLEHEFWTGKKLEGYQTSQPAPTITDHTNNPDPVIPGSPLSPPADPDRPQISNDELQQKIDVLCMPLSADGAMQSRCIQRLYCEYRGLFCRAGIATRTAPRRTTPSIADALRQAKQDR